MDLSGMLVSHATFGDGKVVSNDERYLCVEFASDGQLRQFAFPGAFEGFLRIEQGDRSAVDEALRARKLEALTRKQEQQGRLQAMQRERRAERAAAKKPASRKTAVPVSQ